MPTTATVDTPPLAESSVPAPQAMRAGFPTPLGSVFVLGGSRHGSGNPKVRSRFETIGLQSGSAPKLFGAFLEQDPTTVSSSSHVNPSRGINAKARPQGATGVAQCVELLQQLRGARIALAHNIGGQTAL